MASFDVARISPRREPGRVGVLRASHVRRGRSTEHYVQPGGLFQRRALRRRMKNAIDSIQSNQSFLQTLDRSRLLGQVFTMLIAAVACMKHEGFHRSASGVSSTRPSGSRRC